MTTVLKNGEIVARISAQDAAQLIEDDCTIELTTSELREILRRKIHQENGDLATICGVYADLSCFLLVAVSTFANDVHESINLAAIKASAAKLTTALSTITPEAVLPITSKNDPNKLKTDLERISGLFVQFYEQDFNPLSLVETSNKISLEDFLEQPESES